MLQLKGISIAFGGRKVLDQLDLVVEKGQFVSIIGPNGAGKSTLFRLITGQVAPCEGEIFLNGQPITSLSEQARGLDIGQLCQNPLEGSVGAMSVRENLRLATCKGRRPRLRRARGPLPAAVLAHLQELLKMELTDLLKNPMDALSGGQRQLIAFAMVILSKPSLLLLDEPTAALDPRAAQRLFRFIQQHREHQEVTTLLISHNHELARAVGNTLWEVADQRVVVREQQGSLR